MGTIPKPTTSILGPVSTIVINATTEEFVARKKFVVNTKPNAEVFISYLSNNFVERFLKGDGKTEDLMSVQTLFCANLSRTSFDITIIAALGGEEKSETTLSEMFFLMEKQKRGEDGALLNNSYPNLFYIQDNAGVLRTVSVRWSGGGWGVDAYYLFRWNDGCRVFSRNPVLESSEPSALAQA